ARTRATHLDSDLVDSRLVRDGGGELLFFATVAFIPAGVLRPFNRLDNLLGGWDRFEAVGMGASGSPVSAISNPNKAATSLSSSTLAPLGAVFDSGRSSPALASNSFSSTPRSTKSS